MLSEGFVTLLTTKSVTAKMMRTIWGSGIASGMLAGLMAGSTMSISIVGNEFLIREFCEGEREEYKNKLTKMKTAMLPIVFMCLNYSITRKKQ